MPNLLKSTTFYIDIFFIEKSFRRRKGTWESRNLISFFIVHENIIFWMIFITIHLIFMLGCSVQRSVLHELYCLAFHWVLLVNVIYNETQTRYKNQIKNTPIRPTSDQKYSYKILLCFIMWTFVSFLCDKLLLSLFSFYFSPDKLNRVQALKTEP